MLYHVNEFTKALTSYFSHCRLAKYTAFKKSNIRIVRGFFSKLNDEVMFSVCIPGLNGFPTLSATELANDTKRLQLFSESDQRKILLSAYGLIHDYELIDSDVNFEIAEKYRDTKTHELMLKIYITVANKKFTRIMKVSEIQLNEHLQYFSTRDAYIIGHTNGTEQTLDDFNEISHLKDV